MKSVKIFDGVNRVGAFAFSGCSNLIEVELPSSVNNIGSYAFSGCGSLERITLPKNVTTINTGTFAGCISLSSVEILGDVTNIGDSAFDNCTRLSVIKLNSVVNIGVGAFDGCKALKVITLNSVTEIGNYAFRGCNSLRDVTLPASLKYIGLGAFSVCSSLESVELPWSLCAGAGERGIGDDIFSWCPELKTVKIVADGEINPYIGKIFLGKIFRGLEAGKVRLCLTGSLWCDAEKSDDEKLKYLKLLEKCLKDVSEVFSGVYGDGWLVGKDLFRKKIVDIKNMHN